MSFWQTKDSKPLTGKEGDAGAPTFGLVPNATKAQAEVVEFKRESFQGTVNYQVLWKLTSGSYAGFMVRQKLDVYAEDAKKSDRAKNMMYRLFKLCGIAPSSKDAEPTPMDLMKFKHKELGILVMEWEQDGKQGNWVNMLYPLIDEDTKVPFETKDGKFLAQKSKPVSIHAGTNDDGEEDLPF